MEYKEHLDYLKSKSQEDIQSLIEELRRNTPFGFWPDGMPASVDPKLVLIGVSPGNSPMPEHRREDSNSPIFESEPCVVKSEKNHFYYPDSSGYWKKLRMLCSSYFQFHDNSMDEADSISLTTHLNLGTGAAGSATKMDVERDIIKWVSKLLNKVHEPDTVILFGLKAILSDNEISSWWNHDGGLKINWLKPDIQKPFNSYKKRRYYYRIWNTTNARGKNIKVVLWPNHPSRAPFSNYDIWQKSIDEFLVLSNA